MQVLRIWRATPLLAAIALLTWQTGSTLAGPTAGGHWPPVGSSSSSSAAPAAAPVAVAPALAAARLDVKLPLNAKLWIEGKEIEKQQQSTGFSLTSPPLEAGYNYTYHLRAQWTDNGVQVTRERAVPIHAGETVTIDFLPVLAQSK